MAPKNDFAKNGNNGLLCDIAKKDLGIKLIGVGGNDFTKGDRKSILTLVW